MSLLSQNMEDLLSRFAVENDWSDERLAEVRVIVEEAYSDHLAEVSAVRAANNIRYLARDRAKPNDSEVYVYVMVSRVHGDVKIGISQNPYWRRKALSKEWRGDLALVWFTEAYTRRRATEIERLAHEAMGDDRLDGEWFSCSPEEAIDAVEGAECYVLGRAA